MGVVRGIAFIVVPLIIVLLVLSTTVLVTRLEPREESALGDRTGLLPADRISTDQIHVYPDRVEIDLAGAQWARFTATGSMLPLLGITAHALQIIPKSPEDVKIGDIVSFHFNDNILIHRVIAISTDDAGLYYTTQGDNNPEPDPVRVRFSQIDRVLVGILY